MTIQWGDTGRVAYGSLRSFNISLATAREQVLSAGTTPASFTLPATQPGTPQISLTIAQSDLPTITPTPISVNYTALLYLGGQNSTGTAGGANYVINKNGSLFAQGTISSVSNTYYWTLNLYNLSGVVSGDKLDVYLYGSTALLCDYYGLQIYPIALNAAKTNKILKSVSYTLSTSSLTQGTPVVQGTGNNYIYPTNLTNAYATVSANFSIGAIAFTAGKGMYSLQYGDLNSGAFTNTSTTSRPVYYRDYYPSNISFREVNPS